MDWASAPRTGRAAAAPRCAPRAVACPPPPFRRSRRSRPPRQRPPREIISRTAPPPAGPELPSVPRLKLAFRRFDFVRLGATGSTDGTAASEPFNSLSIDVYPLSSFVRIGLSTQYGWQSGTWTSSGDYFATESLSLGVQLLGRPVVPVRRGLRRHRLHAPPAVRSHDPHRLLAARRRRGRRALLLAPRLRQPRARLPATGQRLRHRAPPAKRVRRPTLGPFKNRDREI